MPSPFPGMDPFIESQLWSDFHTRFITALSDAIVPRVRPQYHVAVERYVYLTLRPVRHQIDMPRRQQAFLTIRTARNRAVITVIELLSPWNKSRPAGQAQYLTKRSNVLYSTANLVELDLLRGGERLPTRKKLQAGQFFAFVTRPRTRPGIDAYGWTLRDPLPTLPIPLKEPDPDVLVDLQSVFTTTYDRAGYDYSLDYTAPLDPPLSKADAKWARARM